MDFFENRDPSCLHSSLLFFLLSHLRINNYENDGIDKLIGFTEDSKFFNMFELCKHMSSTNKCETKEKLFCWKFLSSLEQKCRQTCWGEKILFESRSRSTHRHNPLEKSAEELFAEFSSKTFHFPYISLQNERKKRKKVS